MGNDESSKTYSHRGEDYFTVARYVQYRYAERELIKLLNSIPFVILKGSAAAIYYPIPSSRSFGDIDFIVPPSDFDKAKRLLESNGYTKYSRPQDDDRHCGYQKEGYTFELHKRFSYDDLDIEKYVLAGIENRVLGRIGEYSFPMLPPLPNGLVLLAHMRSHLKSGLGLRQVIDWMMYVDKVLDDKFWYSSFKPAVDEVGLTTLAVTTTALCQKYLGLKERAWVRGVDEEVVDQLLESLLSSGNFGVKHGKGNNVETVTSAMRRNGVFYYLQLAGEHNWKAYHRHHFLRPFCWLYQIFRYVKQGVHRGKRLKEDMKRGNTRYELMKKLKI